MAITFMEQLANCQGLARHLRGTTADHFHLIEEEAPAMTQAPNATLMHTGAVHVVDDDDHTRDAVVEFFRAKNCPAHGYSSAEDFLQSYQPGQIACLLVDERLPGMRGSELLRKLHQDGIQLPSVFVTAFANTPLTVDAMQHGAVTVLDKPCSDSQLAAAVEKALRLSHAMGVKLAARKAGRQRLESMSSQERQVLEMVLEGTPNKQIAKHLNVCVRTVEARRSRVYQTMEVASVAELVRQCVSAGLIEG